MTLPKSHAGIFEKQSFWHIATISPDGTPQSSPVWATFDGTHSKVSLTRGRQKFRNLNTNPAVALSAIDPDNSYRYLEVRGRVVSLEDDTELAFVNSMAKKYMGLDKYPNHRPGDERVVISIEPTGASSMG
jgi:PPOX class probable F420-dependent enzyme